MDKNAFILGTLIILLFLVNYSFLDSFVENYFVDYETVFVSRIIDGDTIVSDGKSIRLLGINAPEKGEKFYDEAKEFLETKITNKTVSLRFGKEKYDLYNRTLAYVFYNNMNLNLELVKKGLANYYFPSGKDFYYSGFQGAWLDCLEENINLCEKSEDKCASCIELKELNVKSQEAVFYNSCGFSCDLTDWKIKDEGRKKFVFGDFVLNSGEEIKITADDFEENYVWTRSGDTLFLRDGEGKLVLWENIV